MIIIIHNLQSVINLDPLNLMIVWNIQFEIPVPFSQSLI